jgi:hypothetical protein
MLQSVLYLLSRFDTAICNRKRRVLFLNCVSECLFLGDENRHYIRDLFEPVKKPSSHLISWLNTRSIKIRLVLKLLLELELGLELRLGLLLLFLPNLNKNTNPNPRHLKCSQITDDISIRITDFGSSLESLNMSFDIVHYTDREARERPDITDSGILQVKVRVSL